MNEKQKDTNSGAQQKLKEETTQLLSAVEEYRTAHPLDAALLSEMLSGQPEFQAVELFEHEIVMQMGPNDTMAEQDRNDHSDPVLSL